MSAADKFPPRFREFYRLANARALAFYL